MHRYAHDSAQNARRDARGGTAPVATAEADAALRVLSARGTPPLSPAAHKECAAIRAQQVTSLEHSIGSGSLRTLKKALTAGASPNLLLLGWCTPLVAALALKRPHMVQMLLQAGALANGCVSLTAPHGPRYERQHWLFHCNCRL